MNVKALKKQLMAAIAMVIVAAVALSSATYAWFVSNNQVTATTTNISAQSNSAYLLIQNAAARTVGSQDNVTGTNTDSTTSAQASETFADVKLYPATIKKEESKAVWYTAYASTKDNAAINDAGFTKIGTNGTADEATTADYNLKNTFYVGTGTYDGQFTDLKVTGLEVNNTANSDLNTAIRVLVTDGTAWVVARPIAVLGKDAYVLTATGEAYTNASDSDEVGYLGTNSATKITKSAYEALQEKTAVTTDTTKWEIESQSGTDGIVHASAFGKTEGDVTLSVYVYYEGSDGRVFTTNLEELKNIGVTITLDATPTTHTS